MTLSGGIIGKTDHMSSNVSICYRPGEGEDQYNQGDIKIFDLKRRVQSNTSKKYQFNAMICATIAVITFPTIIGPIALGAAAMYLFNKSFTTYDAEDSDIQKITFSLAYNGNLEKVAYNIETPSWTDFLEHIGIENNNSNENYTDLDLETNPVSEPLKALIASKLEERKSKGPPRARMKSIQYIVRCHRPINGKYDETFLLNLIKKHHITYDTYNLEKRILSQKNNKTEVAISGPYAAALRLASSEKVKDILGTDFPLSENQKELNKLIQERKALSDNSKLKLTMTVFDKEQQTKTSTKYLLEVNESGEQYLTIGAVETRKLVA